MNKSWRSIAVLALLSLLCLGAAFVTLRATAQNAESPPPKPVVPEESATIQDDSTVAPDSSQSVDNNVSFPVDI